MMRRYRLGDYLDLSGIILVLLPFVFLVFITVSHLGLVQDVTFDYLIPLKLSFLVIPGTIFMLISSFLLKAHVQWSLGLSVVIVLSLLYVMIAPAVFGFESDQSLAHGFWFTLTFIFVAIFDMASLALSVLHIIWLNQRMKVQ